MTHSRWLARGLIAGIALLGVSGAAAPETVPPSGIERAAIEPSVSPCKDFYQFANGAWLDTVRIAGAYPFAGRGLDMYLRNQAVLVGAIESAAARVPVEHDPTLRKLGVLYAALKDSTRADRQGLEPIRARLLRIARIARRRDLPPLFAALQSEGAPMPFELAADADAKDSRRTVAIIRQAGLGLPDRDYYLRSDPASDSLRADYLQHVAAMLVLAGATRSRADQAAAAVVALETALAESSLTAVARRDPESTYHRLTVRDLAALAPGIDWSDYFKAAGIPELADPKGIVVVEAVSFVRELGILVRNSPLDAWRAYLRFHSIETAGSWLGHDVASEVARFSARLTGQRQPTPRWERAVQATNEAMSEALGKAFVARAFPPTARASAMELVDDLQAAFDARLAHLDWMGEATRRNARHKLSTLIKKVGYPDHWCDVSQLAVDPSRSGWEDLREARAFEQRRQWEHIGRPVDRQAWQISAATLNAYYNASNNEIVFPAAFLQPPEFDPIGDDAANYGGAGAVIGHELTHGFDDQGRRFDAAGNLSSWWSGDDGARFEERARRIVEEFDGFVAIDALHINGRLTLGEDLADLGGLTIAYDAYERHLAKVGRHDIDGFTPEQRFFIAYAQSRRSALLPELTREVVLSDPHPPDRWRVNGAVSNLPEFGRAFGCRAGDPMARADSIRTRIW